MTPCDVTMEKRFKTFQCLHSQPPRISNRRNDVGFYQEGGYGTFYGISKPMIERKNKKIVKMCGLSIDI